MKVQPIIPQIKQNSEPNKDNVKFTGAFDAVTLGLRFLETNQAWGANAVDLGSMVIPRTAVDFYNRGPAAGTETARREASGTANHSLVGVYGMLAGLAFASTLNNKFGIKAHKIFVDDETLDILAKAWDKKPQESGQTHVQSYLNDLFSGAQTRIGDNWVNIPQDDVNKVVNKFSEVLSSKNSPLTISKDLKEYAKSVITSATGSETNFRLTKEHHPVELSSMLESVYNVSKAFVSDKAQKVLNGNSQELINSLKKMNKARSILGLGIASAVGMSIQPLNIYLTKKKTGSDGFVGVEGRQKDNSAGFWGLKSAAAGLLGGEILASIGLKDGIGTLLKKIQFKGWVPTINQFKFIYGVTIMSRFMAARDKDELRESVVKDVLGFFNWLVLGNFVAKITANAMDKSLLNYSEKEHGKGFVRKILKAPMKTRDEVLHAGLKAAGISTIENGKALTFKQMLNKLSSSNVSEAIRKGTKKQLMILSLAQVAGYLYSGLVLGVGIPKLNIYMTNKSEAKRKAKLAAEKDAKSLQPQASEQYQSMMKPDNLAFLSNYM